MWVWSTTWTPGTGGHAGHERHKCIHRGLGNLQGECGRHRGHRGIGGQGPGDMVEMHIVHMRACRGDMRDMVLSPLSLGVQI